MSKSCFVLPNNATAWESVPSLPRPMAESASAVAVDSNILYMFGGISGAKAASKGDCPDASNSSFLKQILQLKVDYLRKRTKYTCLGKIGLSLEYETAGACAATTSEAGDGKIYLVGGRNISRYGLVGLDSRIRNAFFSYHADAYVFYSAMGKFSLTKLPPMNHARSSLGCAAIRTFPRGELMLVAAGGNYGFPEGVMVSDSVEILFVDRAATSSTEGWRLTGRLSRPRSAFALWAPLGNGQQLAAVGGGGGSISGSGVERVAWNERSDELPELLPDCVCLK